LLPTIAVAIRGRRLLFFEQGGEVFDCIHAIAIDWMPSRNHFAGSIPIPQSFSRYAKHSGRLGDPNVALE
jgi:hypothetical protein